MEEKEEWQKPTDSSAGFIFVKLLVVILHYYKVLFSVMPAFAR